MEAELRAGGEGEWVWEERVAVQGRHIEALVGENEQIAAEVERTLRENRAVEASAGLQVAMCHGILIFTSGIGYSRSLSSVL